MAVRIAKDAVSIYLNNQNPVNNLTMEQLKKIYSGQVINWSQVGGINEEILVLNRLPSSGTYLYLKEYVLNGKAYTESAVNMPSYNALLRKIAANRSAIGYGGLWSETNIKSCRINGIEPTWKNIMNDQYPLSRYLYFYTANSPEGEVKNFIDWVLGRQGQQVIKDVGYFPIWEF
jgi:phosphate transport system substrate-binding protein